MRPAEAPPQFTQPSDVILWQAFAAAAAAAAVLELKIRLLAGVVPQLQPVALAKKLEDVEGAVLAHFEGGLRAGEMDLLVRTRRMRNKLLHGEFDDLSRQVGPEAPRGPGVTRIKLPEKLTLESLSAALDATAEHERIQDLETTGETLAGWLFDCAQRGVFEATRRESLQGVAVIERLMNEYSSKEAASS